MSSSGTGGKSTKKDPYEQYRRMWKALKSAATDIWCEIDVYIDAEKTLKFIPLVPATELKEALERFRDVTPDEKKRLERIISRVSTQEYERINKAFWTELESIERDRLGVKAGNPNVHASGAATGVHKSIEGKGRLVLPRGRADTLYKPPVEPTPATEVSYPQITPVASSNTTTITLTAAAGVSPSAAPMPAAKAERLPQGAPKPERAPIETGVSVAALKAGLTLPGQAAPASSATSKAAAATASRSTAKLPAAASKGAVVTQSDKDKDAAKAALRGLFAGRASGTPRELAPPPASAPAAAGATRREPVPPPPAPAGATRRKPAPPPPATAPAGATAKRKPAPPPPTMQAQLVQALELHRKAAAGTAPTSPPKPLPTARSTPRRSSTNPFDDSDDSDEPPPPSGSPNPFD